ncbi:hypothetical protein PDR5_05760 [Pseudomonas sp. DR 5-09]|nr:hypothetical protein PDR5_05760 [Pseudomonas sp. DR 5-09]
MSTSLDAKVSGLFCACLFTEDRHIREIVENKIANLPKRDI